MNKPQLERYAVIKSQITELEAEAEKIKPEIVASMEAEEAEKVETDFGAFVLEKRRTWEFSEKIQMAENDVKEMKAKEKGEGIATYVELPVLKFFPK